MPSKPSVLDEQLRELHLIKIYGRFLGDGIIEFAKIFLKLTDIQRLNAKTWMTTGFQYKWRAMQTWQNCAKTGKRKLLELLVIARDLQCGNGQCGCDDRGSRQTILDILEENDMEDDLNDDVMLAVVKSLTNEHMDKMLPKMHLSRAKIENQLPYEAEQTLQQYCFKLLSTWLKQNPKCTVLSLYVLLRQAENYSCVRKIVEPGTAELLYDYAVAKSRQASNTLEQNKKADMTRWGTILSGISRTGLALSCRYHGNALLSPEAKVCVEVTTSLSTVERMMEDYLTGKHSRWISELSQYNEVLSPVQPSSSRDPRSSSSTGLTFFATILQVLMIAIQDVRVEPGYNGATKKPLMQINLENQSYSLLLEEKATTTRMEIKAQDTMKDEKRLEDKVAARLRSKYLWYHKLKVPSSHNSAKQYSHDEHYIQRQLRAKHNPGVPIQETSFLHEVMYYTVVPRVVILASSGSGKSTLCRNICREWVNENSKYLKMSHFNYVFLIDGNQVRQTDTISGYIIRELLGSNIITETRLDSLLEKYEPHILFLIDGIDQMKATISGSSRLEDQDTTGFMSLLEGNCLSTSTVIITGIANANNVMRNQEQLNTYEIVPFSYQDIKQFVSTLPDKVKSKWQDYGFTRNQLTSSIETPLFLWSAVRLCESESGVSAATPGGLTKTFLMTALYPPAEHKNEYLQNKRLQKKTYISFRDNQDYFSFSNSDAMQAYMKDESGILTSYQPDGTQSSRVCFRYESHVTKAFFAAQYIVRRHSPSQILKTIANLAEKMKENRQDFRAVLCFVVGLLSMKATDNSHRNWLLRFKARKYNRQRCRELCATIITKHCRKVKKNDELHKRHDILSCIAEAAPIFDQEFCHKIQKKLRIHLYYNKVLCTNCCGKAMTLLLRHGTHTVHINGGKTNSPEKLEELLKSNSASRREGFANQDNLKRALGPNGVYNGVEIDRFVVEDCPKKLTNVVDIRCSELKIANCNPLLAEQLIREAKGMRKIELCDMSRTPEQRECMVHALVEDKPGIQEVKLKDKSYSIQKLLVQKLPKLRQLTSVSLDAQDSDITPDQEVELVDMLLDTSAPLQKVQYTAKHGSALKNIKNLVEKLGSAAWKVVRFVGTTILEITKQILECTGIGQCLSLFTADKSNEDQKPSAVLVIGDDVPLSQAWKELLASGTDLDTVELHCNDLPTLVTLLKHGFTEKTEEFQNLQIDHLKVNLKSELSKSDYERHNLIQALPKHCTDLHVRGSKDSTVEVRIGQTAGKWFVRETEYTIPQAQTPQPKTHRRSTPPRKPTASKHRKTNNKPPSSKPPSERSAHAEASSTREEPDSISTRL